MNTIGNVFDIQKMCLNDGPGIRTTVFLKGCNLHCKWCHNPESISLAKQMMFYANKCTACRQCMQACRYGAHTFIENGHCFDRSVCRLCGACCEVCPNEALMIKGKNYTVEELSQIVLRDKMFYGSSGGVTVSGGEPMLQVDFITLLFKELKKQQINTAVDTAGNVDFSSFEKILPYTDLFLYDIKAATPTIHKTATGADNAQIIANLNKLAGMDVDIWIRIPVIPDINATIEEINRICECIPQSKSIKRVELLNFHRLAQSKYKALDIKSSMPQEMPNSKETMEALAGVVRKYGFTVTVNI